MARKKKKKTTRRAATRSKASARKRKVARRGRPTGLSGVSFEALQKEIDRRKNRLADRRETLMAELEEIEAQLEGMDESPAPATRGRPRKTTRKASATRGRVAKKSTGRRGGRSKGKGGKNLVDSLHAALRGKTLSVAEVADAVQRAGYKTASANFRTIVNGALLKEKSKFRKVSRGLYTAK